MKYLAAVLILVVLAQSAEIPRPRETKLFPRSHLFPRPQQPQGPGHFIPTRQPHSINTRGFCGHVKVNRGRIVGGKEAVPHEFPWQVAVTIDGNSFCGGSLISPAWILTAAHCADAATRFSILLGAHDRTIREPSQVTVTSNTYTVHPSWNSSTLANDIALIRLPNPVTLTPEIEPICLAPATEPDHVGDTLLVSGWGRTADGAFQTISATLNKVTAPGISTAQCAATFGTNILNDKILCIDTTGGKDSCKGDSGGPLSFDRNGVLNQVGIVSFGSSDECTRGLPSAFTRVSSYAQWISDTTGLII